MNKRFLSEVTDGARSVKTEKRRKEMEVCDFGSGSGIGGSREARRSGGALRQGPPGLHRPEGGREPAPAAASKGPGGDLASVLPATPPPTAGDRLRCRQTGRRSKPQETRPPPSLLSQPWVTFLTSRIASLSCSRIRLLTGLPVPFPFKPLLHPAPRDLLYFSAENATVGSFACRTT